MAKVGAGKLILREGEGGRLASTKNVAPRSSIHPFAPKQQKLVMSLRRRKEDFWLSTSSKAGKLRILRFFWCFALRQAFVQLLRSRERDRRLHFNLFLSPFAISHLMLFVAAAVALKRTGISLLGGKKWPHTSLRAFFLLSLSFLHPLSLHAGRKGEKIGVARARAFSRSCDASERCLSDDRLVFHSSSLSSLPAKTSHPPFLPPSLTPVVLSRKLKATFTGAMKQSEER